MLDIQYPLIAHPLNSGFDLLLPDPVDVKCVFEKKKLAGEQVEFPYWTRIWPSAKGMAECFLEEPHWVQGKKILELAAGIGLPSFAIAHIAESIVVSDVAEDAVNLLDINIRRNDLRNVTAQQIDWNNHSTPISGTDLLILSDVCYDPSQYDVLLKLIANYKNQGTTVILSAPQRISTGPFHHLISPWLSYVWVRKIDEIEIAVFVL